MQKLIEENYRYLFIAPISSILIFTITFDTTIHRFDFSPLFENFNPSSLKYKASFFLVQLSTVLVIFACILALFMTKMNFDRISYENKSVSFLVSISVSLSFVFIYYNLAGYADGYSNYIYFIKGIFDEHIFKATEKSWETSKLTFNVLYYLPLALVIISSIFLAASSTSLAAKIHSVTNADDAIQKLEEKRRLILLSFYSASLLVSSMVLQIFFWHNLERAAISDPLLTEPFTAFMFSYSFYWGIAYSLIIFFTFFPVIFVFNFQLSNFAELQCRKDGVSKRKYLENISIDYVSLSDTSKIAAVFSPMLTGLSINSLSIFVPG